MRMAKPFLQLLLAFWIFNLSSSVDVANSHIFARSLLGVYSPPRCAGKAVAKSSDRNAAANDATANDAAANDAAANDASANDAAANAVGVNNARKEAVSTKPDFVANPPVLEKDSKTDSIWQILEDQLGSSMDVTDRPAASFFVDIEKREATILPDDFSLKGEKIISTDLFDDSKGDQKIKDQFTNCLVEKKNLNSPAVAYCVCLGRINDFDATCNHLQSLSNMISCRLQDLQWCSSTSFEIPPMNETTSSTNIFFLDANLPTPLSIPSNSKDELASYHLLWKSIAVLTKEAESVLCKNKFPQTQVLTGWEAVHTVHLVENNENVLPFARLAKKVNTDNQNLVDILISMRGVLTPVEWALSLSYNLVATHLTMFKGGGVHRGFLTLANSVGLALQSEMDRLYARNRLGLITLAGHDMGGATAMALAYIIASRYSKFLPNGQPRIRAVGFAAPRLGDAISMSRMRSEFVMRSLSVEFDLVPHLPCVNAPYCRSVSVPTGSKNEGNANFASYPGAVPLAGINDRNFLSRLDSSLSDHQKWHSNVFDALLSGEF